MIRIDWQDVAYEVERIVTTNEIRKRFESSLSPIAQRYGLLMLDESAEPAPGDFWIGCSPDRGWGNADPYRVAWASSFEIREALSTLNAVLPKHREVKHSLFRWLFPTPHATPAEAVLA